MPLLGRVTTPLKAALTVSAEAGGSSKENVSVLGSKRPTSPILPPPEVTYGGKTTLPLPANAAPKNLPACVRVAEMSTSDKAFVVGLKTPTPF